MLYECVSYCEIASLKLFVAANRCRTKTPGPGAQSALRALARSGMKIGRIGQCVDIFLHVVTVLARVGWAELPLPTFLSRTVCCCISSLSLQNLVTKLSKITFFA